MFLQAEGQLHQMETWVYWRIEDLRYVEIYKQM